MDSFGLEPSVADHRMLITRYSGLPWVLGAAARKEVHVLLFYSYLRTPPQNGGGATRIAALYDSRWLYSTSSNSLVLVVYLSVLLKGNDTASIGVRASNQRLFEGRSRRLSRRDWRVRARRG